MTSEAREHTAQAATCVHHWLIDAPNGRESVGHCSRCGKVRSFTNSTEAVMWEQTNTLRSDLSGRYRSSKINEVTLADDSPVIDRTISDIGFPRDASIVAVVRREHVEMPRGDTRFEAGDEVLALVTPDSEDAVRHILTRD